MVPKRVVAPRGKHESKQKLFVDEEEIKNEYYPETEQLLKDA